MIVLDEKYLTVIRDICKEVFHQEGVQVVLYGSRARGPCRDSSDIDLAVISKAPMHYELQTFRERIGNSTIPFFFDIVEFGDLSDTFRENIKSEGVVIWKS